MMPGAAFCVSLLVVFATPLQGQAAQEADPRFDHRFRAMEVAAELGIGSTAPPHVPISFSLDEPELAASGLHFSDERVIGTVIGAAAGLGLGLYQCSRQEGSICLPGIIVRTGAGAAVGLIAGAVVRSPDGTPYSN